LGRYLGRSLRQDVLEPQPQRGLERLRDPFRRLARRVVPEGGDGGQVVLEGLDVRCELHGQHYDITEMSYQVVATST